jgi:hypothetical protein
MVAPDPPVEDGAVGALPPPHPAAATTDRQSEPIKDLDAIVMSSVSSGFLIKPGQGAQGLFPQETEL